MTGLPWRVQCQGQTVTASSQAFGGRPLALTPELPGPLGTPLACRVPRAQAARREVPLRPASASLPRFHFCLEGKAQLTGFCGFSPSDTQSQGEGHGKQTLQKARD